MILIAAVDDRMGLSFNGRRLSRDKFVTERIISLTDGKPLFVNEYSAKLFGDIPQIHISSGPLSEAGEADFCFTENLNPSRFENRIKKIILFKWNRSYPSDLKLGIDLSSWQLKESNDFAGSSHKKITEEVYVK